VTPLRVALAGLVAGAVNLVAGFAFAHLVGVERLQALLRDHGLRPIGEHPADAIPHTAVRLLLGLGVTTLYACLVARFGAGPRAALAAAGFAWAFVYAYTAWGHAHIGLFPRSMAFGLAAWGAVEMTLTALAGAWVATGRTFWSG
jgi:hypothetical protein